MQRTASCHCGNLSLICSGEPRKISMCHCFECQRRTGSLFSVAVFYQRSQVGIGEDRSRVFERPSASGFPVAFHFCPDCGTNLWWEPRRMPDLVGVAAGCFADPALPMPAQAVFADERHHWLPLPPEIPLFPGNSASGIALKR